MAARKGLKDERLVKEIQERGSKALPAPNPSGVRLSKKAKPSPERPVPKIGANQIRPVEKVQPTLDYSTIDIDNIKTDPLYGYISEKEIDGGIISGKLIRPNYNVKELKKSIDTEIFELLPNEAPDLPDTVLRSIYDGALEQIDDLTAEVQRLNIDVNDLTAKVAELEIVSESLKIEADNQTLSANIASEQRDIANTQIASTTIDLQNAVQNSINEAIERVSLTARIEALQESFRVQKELTEEREKQNAAQNALEGLNGFFQQTENSGWKISANDVKSEGTKGIYFETKNARDFKWRNGEKGIAFFNFSTEEQTFTISESIGWIEFPTSFKVPARNEQSAGVTTVTFKVSNVGKTKPRKKTLSGTIVINTSSGDKLELKAYYKKEVKRKDKWGSRGKVQVFVGQDKTGG